MCSATFDGYLPLWTPQEPFFGHKKEGSCDHFSSGQKLVLERSDKYFRLLTGPLSCSQHAESDFFNFIQLFNIIQNMVAMANLLLKWMRMQSFQLKSQEIMQVVQAWQALQQSWQVLIPGDRLMTDYTYMVLMGLNKERLGYIFCMSLSTTISHWTHQFSSDHWS